MKLKNRINSIYTESIKPYRKDRLFFSAHFRKLYFEIDPQVTLCQREMQLCTHMRLQRFREDEILIVMTWWYAQHKVQHPNWWRLRNFVLPKTKAFAQPILKKQKQEEYQRRKQRKLEQEQKGEKVNRRSA